MLSKILEWLFGSHISTFNRGKNYVVEQLSMGRSRDELEVEADNPFDSNDFEKGMQAALWSHGIRN